LSTGSLSLVIDENNGIIDPAFTSEKGSRDPWASLFVN